MAVIDKRTQQEWKPVLVIDTEDMSRLFMENGLPTPAELEKALWSAKLGNGKRKIRVRHYVPYDKTDQYNPSITMLNFAVAYDMVFEGEPEPGTHQLYFKEVGSKKRISETLSLIRKGIVKKAVFEIENYDLGVVFHLNTQWQFLVAKKFNLFACDFSIYDKIEVIFDFWRFVDNRKKGKENEKFWEIREVGSESELFAPRDLREDAIRVALEQFIGKLSENDPTKLTIRDIAQIRTLIE